MVGLDGAGTNRHRSTSKHEGNSASEALKRFEKEISIKMCESNSIADDSSSVDDDGVLPSPKAEERKKHRVQWGRIRSRGTCVWCNRG